MEKAKVTENPHGIAFGLRAYNATPNGAWVDLLDGKNNKKHAAAMSHYPKIITKGIKRLWFNFDQGVDHKRIKININGCEFLTGLFFSPMAYQSNMISIDKYINELKEFKIFLPYSMFAVDVMATLASPETDVSDCLQIGDQFCVRVKNNRRRDSILMDILNLPNDNNLAESEVVFNDAKKIYQNARIFFNQIENARKTIKMEYKNTSGSLFITDGVRVDQFQPNVYDFKFDKPVNFDELAKFETDLHPGEELMFYFYN